jgi:small GTP-binding protein
MSEAKQFKLKVSLVGEQGVGKTSLVHRFVSGAYDESYIRTLGVVVSKKTVALDALPQAIHVDMMISDIMGEQAFLDLFGGAYFQGTHGVLAVFDVTRKSTLSALGAWIAKMRHTVGPLPVCILGNKIDLRELRETTEQDAAEALRPFGCPILYTSAKTGENVEEAFHGLAKAIIGPEVVE